MQLCSSDNKVLVPRLERAASMWARTRGLLGRKGLADEEALWIDPCSSIHTHFMRFTIDVVFLDADLSVVKVLHQLAPWKVRGGGRKARSVVEMAAGRAEALAINVGDVLHTVQ